MKSSDYKAECFLVSNPGCGFILSHAALCCKVVGPKDALHFCRQPIFQHAKRGGWCGNVCQSCAKHEAAEGAVLTNGGIIVEQLQPVTRPADDEPASAKVAADTPATEQITASAAEPAQTNGNGSTPLFDRIAERSADNPILRSDLTTKERKLARDLAVAGVIMRDESNGRIKYYAKA